MVRDIVQTKTQKEMFPPTKQNERTRSFFKLTFSFHGELCDKLEENILYIFTSKNAHISSVVENQDLVVTGGNSQYWRQLSLGTKQHSENSF